MPGVGRKTGNVVRSVWFHVPGLPVDTHVTRLSHLLKLTNETDPVKIEKDLGGMVPPEEWGMLSLRLIEHGRQVCIARAANAASAALPRSARRPSASASGDLILRAGWTSALVEELPRPVERTAGADQASLGTEELARERGVGSRAVALGHLGDPMPEILELGADAGQHGDVAVGAHRASLSLPYFEGLIRGGPVR